MDRFGVEFVSCGVRLTDVVRQEPPWSLMFTGDVLS